jgi:hypothetical protein
MKFEIIKDQIQSNLREALRRAGYFSITDRFTNKTSYVRRLSATQHYPRFHLYIIESASRYVFDLHLDQKRVSYHGQRAHSGEDDGSLVSEEMERITACLDRS